MASFSGLGIGLSFLFGCMVMGFAAELYYLLWVRKRISKRSTYGSELCSLFCWKKTCSLSKIGTQEVTTDSRNQETNDQDQDLELGTNNDLLLKGFGEDSEESSSHSMIRLEGCREEDSAEAELMRLHNFRFLSTIKEESKEDLESDDGKSRGDRSRKGSRTRSLSDHTLVLTPLSSPPVNYSRTSDSYNSQEFSFNPLFESEIRSLKTSPPPKFKFLRDAEEKLIRRLIEEAEKRKKVISNADA
ncbi:hypothetical protein HAX54_034652 [Datura stramonium]|uniref:Uncharacterized protein n=1 Tax=Datura stramonium TaxID=4076 RepID=A0ABS8SES2_DATST|nr:hypothetical protein [Datura stramonium]